MDPNTTLAELDSAHADLHAALRNGASRGMVSLHLAVIAERASALDLWIVRGGFLPTEPAPARLPTTHVWLA